jgi:hypothetical protein
VVFPLRLRFRLERLGQLGGVVAARIVVEVALSGRIVLVAHIGLDRMGVQRRDRGRAESVPQIVKAETTQARSIKRRVAALA